MMAAGNRMAPVHPGEVLRDELDELGLSANALAHALDIPANRISAILNGQRGITADTALRLARYFGTTPELWLNLQKRWELRRAQEQTSTSVLSHIPSMHVEDLRKAAKAALSAKPPLPAATVLRTIEQSRDIRELLSAAERPVDTIERHFKMMRSFEGPLDEFRRAGLFQRAVSFHSQLPATQRWLTHFERRFQLPDTSTAAKLLEQYHAMEDGAKTLTQYGLQVSALRRAVQSFNKPWLDRADSIGSIRRAAELQGIGSILVGKHSYSRKTAESLRSALGDWREPIDWPPVIETDLVERADFYAELGFDQTLTDLPAPAFREATELAGLRTESVSLDDSHGPIGMPFENEKDRDGLERTNEAHRRLFYLEQRLRHFIADALAAAFGGEWPDSRLPGDLRDQWAEKRAKATKARRKDRPLIDYADFTDYERIICKKGNWNAVFKPVFSRPENVQESFRRLHMIRLDTMHARPITQDDELLLYVEAKRLTQQIAAD